MKKLGVFVLGFMMLSVVGCSKSMNVTVKENIQAEYGDKLDTSLLFDKEASDENVSVKEVKGFDSKKIGEQEITVIFTNTDDNTKEETIKVSVKDTKKPKIKFKKEKVEITEGDKFNVASNIESVKDPIDGDIKKSDDTKLTKNGYIITSDVNNKKAGKYTVKVTAYDVNGNKAESSYQVTVKAKPKTQTTQSSSQSSSNSYSSNTTSTTGSKTTVSSGSTSNKGSNSTTTKKPAQSTNKPHVHRGNAVEGMYFDTLDEADTWAREYIEYQGYVLGNDIGAAYGAGQCSCGKYYINGFR